MSRRKSAMTIRAYRVTSSGERIELSRDEVCLGEPYVREITLAWPDCACRRCVPQWERQAAALEPRADGGTSHW